MRPWKRSSLPILLATCVLLPAIPVTAIYANTDSAVEKNPRLVEKQQPDTLGSILEHATVWTTDDGLTENAFLLLAQINQAETEGLDPARYHLAVLSELAEKQWHAALRQPFDELLAAAFKQLVTDLGQGMVEPERAQRSWFQKTPDVNADNAYLALKLPGNTVESVLSQYRPGHDMYTRLAEALVEYRGYAMQGGWPDIPAGDVIKQGMSDPRLPLIRQRLAITGDLVGSSNLEYVYSMQLVDGVRNFQARHGLLTDGILGKNTLAAMNVTVEARIDSIRINLERLRWLPRDLGERYVLTNIADYRLRVFDQGRSVLEMPVVVGKAKFKTPVFSDEIQSLVFNPTWTVPKSIMYRELLPRERRDPGYLQRNNFELIREESGVVVTREPASLSPQEFAARPFRYTLRQKPGRGNALGNTKFVLPNKYSIFLHDTPTKSLFKQSQRAYSAGCVRVGNPRALADTLLGFEGWSVRQVNRIRRQDKTSRVVLKEQIPNHIIYLTSWAESDGKVQFRDDIYEHDAGLRLALENPRKVKWPAAELATLENR